MPHGTWQTTGGGGGDAVAVLVAAGAVAVVCAVVYVAARAVAAVPAWVWVAVPVTGVMVAVVTLVFLVRHSRRKAAMAAAMFAARHAAELAGAEARAGRHRQAQIEDHQRRLELAAASAPVIHNHVWTSAEAARAAMSRPYTPATVITNQQEIQR